MTRRDECVVALAPPKNGNAPTKRFRRKLGSSESRTDGLLRARLSNASSSGSLYGSSSMRGGRMEKQATKSMLKRCQMKQATP